MKHAIKSEIEHQLKRIVALVCMLFIIVTSTVSVAALSKKVCITDGENIITLTTLSKETDKILEQAGIAIESDDLVKRDDDSYDYIDITIKRAFNVWISVDGICKKISFNEGTVNDALAKANIQFSSIDAVEPALDDEITVPTNIEVIRRCNINLTVDGETKLVPVPSYANIKEAMEYAGVTLGEDDIVNIARDEQIRENMNITVKRVGYRESTYVEEIKHGTMISVSDSLPEGQQKVTREGIDGERVVVKREKIVDGEIVESTEISSEVKREAISEKRVVGMKNTGKSTGSLSKGTAKDNKNGTLVDHFGNTISYKSVLTGSGTAYTSSPGAITATGKPAQVGHVAVDPKKIPYGTKLYITSTDGSFVYGYAVASDTGGALKSGSALVDLYYDTLNECYQFGRRQVAVYILN